MFLYALGMSSLATTGKVVLQVVHLYIYSGHIARLADALDILHIWRMLVVRKQLECLDDNLRDVKILDIAEVVPRILNYIVQKTYNAL